MLAHLGNPDPRDPLVESSGVVTAEILDILGLLLNLGVLGEKSLQTPFKNSSFISAFRT